MEEIQSMMKQLSIIQREINSSTELANPINIENEKVIFEIDSDNDNNPVFPEVKNEEGSTSNPHTNYTPSKRDYPNTSLESDEYAYRQGYYKRKGKWKTEPPNGFKLSQATLGVDNILDLDCVIDPRKILQEWSNRLHLNILINPELRRMTAVDSWNYVMYKTKGNVFNYLSGITEGERVMYVIVDAITTTKTISKLIATEFLGLSETENQKSKI
ncbi:uncharacterized protein [Rutidosis leptorrhynchoides]|uniref:uncharacterized protein n=1 Tax=Rutidosis leptorrhynchoides TaxID=125765 RepID=UPI003A9A35F4